MLLRLATLHALALSALVGCSSQEAPQTTEVKDLAFNRGAKNIALLLGAPNGLEGVAVDIKGLNELFKNNNLGFEVRTFGNATKRQMLDESAKAAKDVGADGTLFWFYSGHGAEGGDLYAADQQFVKSAEIAEAMRSQREQPVKRLLMFLDSCFSGEFVNGRQSMSYSANALDGIAAEQSDAMSAALDGGGSGSYAASKTYEQMLIESAASKDQTSEDLGTAGGGAFTMTFRKVFADLAKKPDSATVQDLAQQSKDQTSRQFSHTPQFRAVPETILTEKLFAATPGNQPTGGGLAQDLALLLGAESGTDRYDLYAGAGPGIASLALCLGDAATCKTSLKKDLTFHVSRQAGDRTIFASDQNLGLTAGGRATLLGFKADGSLGAIRGLVFNKN